MKFTLMVSFDLNIIVKTKEKIIINGIRNFLVCFWKIITKKIVKRNIRVGILFPAIIKPIKKMIKKIGIINL